VASKSLLSIPYPTLQCEATNKQFKQGSLVNSLQKLSAFYSQTNPRVSH
jgi:hypothetical protein